MKYYFTLVFFLATLMLHGQEETKKSVTITTSNGDRITGVIIESNEDKMILKTAFGTAEVFMNRIDKVSYKGPNKTELTDSAILGDNNYSASHYLISSSGYGLQQGEKYYENIYLVWNTLGIGLTRNLSINIAGELISPLFTQNLPITAITPKLSFPMDDIGSLGIGATLYTYPNDGDAEFAGSLNAALTFGSRQNNVTFNGSLAFGSDVDLNELIPFSVSAMFKISDRFSFVTENWIVIQDDSDFSSAETFSAFSANLRYHFPNNKSSFTFGLWRPTEDLDNLIAFPFASGTLGF